MLKSGPSNTDERYQPSWQMQGMTQSKKSNKHFHNYNYPHQCFSSKPNRRGDFHQTWKGKEGSKHLRAGDGNKVILISFLFWCPHPPSSPCLLLAFSISLPYFRMGVHGPGNAWVSCKDTAQKTRYFLLGLAYPALFFQNGRLWMHLSSWSIQITPASWVFLLLRGYQWLAGTLK